MKEMNTWYQVSETESTASHGRHFGITKNVAVNYGCVSEQELFAIYISEVDFLGPSLQTLLDIAETFLVLQSVCSLNPFIFSS